MQKNVALEFKKCVKDNSETFLVITIFVNVTKMVRLASSVNFTGSKHYFLKYTSFIGYP